MIVVKNEQELLQMTSVHFSLQIYSWLSSIAKEKLVNWRKQNNNSISDCRVCYNISVKANIAENALVIGEAE